MQVPLSTASRERPQKRAMEPALHLQHGGGGGGGGGEGGGGGGGRGGGGGGDGGGGGGGMSWAKVVKKGGSD